MLEIRGGLRNPGKKRGTPPDQNRSAESRRRSGHCRGARRCRDEILLIVAPLLFRERANTPTAKHLAGH
jgi:hypothetical protein